MLIVAVVSALVATALQTPTYRASTKIVVGQTGGLFQPQFGNAAQPFTQTMSSLLESDVVAKQVIENLGLRTSPENLLDGVHVSTRPDSSVLDVSFDSSDKDEAVRVLGEVATVFTTLVGDRLGRPAGSTPTSDSPDITARVFDPAHLEPGQVSPRPIRNIALAGVLVLALGVVLAFLRENLDDRVRSPRDAQDWFGTDVIAAFPKGTIGQSPFGLATATAPASIEALRASDLLRASVQFSTSDVEGATVLVTSTAPEEGKTTVTAQLAVALAMSGQEVVCIEADIQRPSLHRYLGLDADGHVGVAIEGRELDVERALLPVSLIEVSAAMRAEAAAMVAQPLIVPGATDPALHLAPDPVAAALARPEPDALESGRLRAILASQLDGNLLKGDGMGSLVRELRLAHATYVICDAPPILSMGGAFSLLATADKVLLVAREGRTKRDLAETTRNLLDRLGVGESSVVLVEARSAGGAPTF
jgi:capsular polysaccharide biosynthesis protein/Mrp family chromosome partitioning ATPase